MGLTECHSLYQNSSYANGSAYKLIYTPEEITSTPCYKLGEAFHGLASRVWSAVSSYLPHFPFASGEKLPQLPVMTIQEKGHLTELEVLILLATNAPEDRRYLRLVRDEIDTYMKEHDTFAYPSSMIKTASELLNRLSERQAMDLELGVPQIDEEWPPLSENCFYHQLDRFVKRMFTICDLESINHVRAVRKLEEIFLENSETKLFTPDVLRKSSDIMRPLSNFQKALLKQQEIPILHEPPATE